MTTRLNTREHPYPTVKPPNHRGPWTYNYNGSFNENENQCALAGLVHNTKVNNIGNNIKEIVSTLWINNL